MNEQVFPACILLAAGASRRMGRDKLNLCLTGGQTVLQRTLTQLDPMPFCEKILVVRSQKQLTFSHLGFLVLEIGAEADLGLHRSLKLGLKKLSSTATAALVSLADQPLITTENYRSLLAAYDNAGCSLFQPVQEGRPGNPAVIPANYFPEIFAEPDSDRGARYLFERHREKSHFWETQEPNFFVDLDCPEDFQKITGQTGQTAHSLPNRQPEQPLPNRQPAHRGEACKS